MPRTAGKNLVPKKGGRVRKDGSPWIPAAQWKKMQQTKGGNTIEKAYSLSAGVDQLQAKAKVKILRERDGTQGIDPRSNSNRTVIPHQDMMATQSKAIEITPSMVPQSYWGVLMSVFSDAYAAGFQQHALEQGKPSMPYQAFCYLVQTLETAIQDGTPTMTTCPLWFAILYDSLRQKTVRWRTGSMTYKFRDTNLGIVPPSKISIATGADFTFYTMVPNPLTVNGYQVLEPPVPYVPGDGLDSFTYFMNFMSQGATSRDRPMWQTVELTSIVSKDTSAYAACYPEIGITAMSQCGFTTELFHEARITRPLFAKFCSWEDDNKRSFHPCGNSVSGGGPFYLGGRLTEATSRRELFNPYQPIIKRIDFQEFVEVLSMYLGKTMFYGLQFPNVNAPVVCPLTYQDVKILLRQAIMGAFQHSQAIGSDLLSDDQYGFIPLQVSAGTYGQEDNSSMLLPILLVENIRALQRRVLKVKQTKTTPGGAYDFLPVWGIYSDDTIFNNYEYDNDNGSSRPVYKDSVVAGELPIRITDGYVNMTPSPTPPLDGYVGFAGLALTAKYQLWNEYIQSLSAFSMTVVPLSTDGGINALEAVTMSSNYVATTLEPTPVIAAAVSPKGTPSVTRKNSSSKRSFGSVIDVRKSVTVSPVGGNVGDAGSTDLSCTRVTSNQPFLKAAWEVQGYFLFPSNRSTGQREDPNFVTAYQSSVNEPYSLPIAANPLTVEDWGSAVVFNKHMSIAAVMANPFESKPNMIEEQLKTFAAQGRGGFLGSVIGSFANAFLPALESLIPF